MIDLRKREVHPHLLRNHGDDINEPPANRHERFALQNANGIAKGLRIEAFDVIQATKGLHIRIFGITEPNMAMTMERKNLINIKARKAFGCATVTCTSTPHKNRDYHLK